MTFPLLYHMFHSFFFGCSQLMTSHEFRLLSMSPSDCQQLLLEKRLAKAAGGQKFLGSSLDHLEPKLQLFEVWEMML